METSFLIANLKNGPAMMMEFNEEFQTQFQYKLLLWNHLIYLINTLWWIWNLYFFSGNLLCLIQAKCSLPDHYRHILKKNIRKSLMDRHATSVGTRKLLNSLYQNIITSKFENLISSYKIQPIRSRNKSIGKTNQ